MVSTRRDITAVRHGNAPRWISLGHSGHEEIPGRSQTRFPTNSLLAIQTSGHCQGFSEFASVVRSKILPRWRPLAQVIQEANVLKR